MDTNRWEKVRGLFGAALDVPPDKRERFLDNACAGDDELRREIESLLASSDDAGSFMEHPAIGKVADIIESSGRKIETGRCFGHYEIVRQIGAGGMGEVYLAKDKKLDRPVAIKILNEQFSREESNLQRFIREAKSASGLNHPNILVVHEVGESDNAHYIVSEFIKGKTLREKLKESQLLPAEVLDITIQTANALAAAHEAHLVHRDIKPENIMIRPDGFVKVLDFGLAKLIEQKNKTILGLEDITVQRNPTAKGVILGTINYMSPEQARGLDVDARTDVWSLGVLLYEMIAGRTPFAGETTSDTISAILNKNPAPLSVSVPDVPKELERITGKTLRKNRDERYQHIRDLLIDLKDFKQELDFQAKLERSAAPDKKHINSLEKNPEAQTQILETEPTGAPVETISTKDEIAPTTTSSAEYIFSEIRAHRRASFAVLAILLASIIGLGYWFFSNRAISPDAEQIKSIAVLPFENGSGDAGLDYLSDGLSESLIDKLSQLPQLKVIARNSSFKYRGGGVDVQEVANKLGVRAIVMGKVSRVGDNLGVRVEMIDAGENRQLWSEQYNRKFSDLLAVQQEIAQTASEKLRLRLSGAQEQQLVKRETVNSQAYELLLKSRYILTTTGGTDNWKKSVEYMQQAVNADPNYALAYAELGNGYFFLAANNLVDPKEYLPKAEAATRRALELDENLPEAHITLARLMSSRWQWEDSLREYQRAFELDPNNVRTHLYYTELLNFLGRPDEAIMKAGRAKELDPLSPGPNFALANSYYFARSYDKAIAEVKKFLELNQNSSSLNLVLGYAYAGKGEFKEAAAAFQEDIQQGNKTTSVKIWLGAAYAQGGEGDKARAILKELETTKEYVSPGELAILYAALGDQESAFRSLEQAFAEHDLQLQFLKVEQGYDSLRGAPRFKAMLKRLNLPE